MRRGAWDKSDAATFFWRFDEAGLRKIREALDAAFIPVGITNPPSSASRMSLRPFDNPCNVPRLAIRGKGACYKGADSAVAPQWGWVAHSHWRRERSAGGAL